MGKMSKKIVNSSFDMNPLKLITLMKDHKVYGGDLIKLMDDLHLSIFTLTALKRYDSYTPYRIKGFKPIINALKLSYNDLKNGRCIQEKFSTSSATMKIYRATPLKFPTEGKYVNDGGENIRYWLSHMITKFNNLYAYNPIQGIDEKFIEQTNPEMLAAFKGTFRVLHHLGEDRLIDQLYEYRPVKFRTMLSDDKYLSKLIKYFINTNIPVEDYTKNMINREDSVLVASVLAYTFGINSFFLLGQNHSVHLFDGITGRQYESENIKLKALNLIMNGHDRDNNPEAFDIGMGLIKQVFCDVGKAAEFAELTGVNKGWLLGRYIPATDNEKAMDKNETIASLLFSSNFIDYSKTKKVEDEAVEDPNILIQRNGRCKLPPIIAFDRCKPVNYRPVRGEVKIEEPKYESIRGKSAVKFYDDAIGDPEIGENNKNVCYMDIWDAMQLDEIKQCLSVSFCESFNCAYSLLEDKENADPYMVSKLDLCNPALDLVGDSSHPLIGPQLRGLVRLGAKGEVYPFEVERAMRETIFEAIEKYKK